jgi:hypothetical protein
MSISYKKINSMIADEVNLISDLSQENKKILRELCEKIYILESSINQASNQQTISDIKGEIVLKADSFIEKSI